MQPLGAFSLEFHQSGLSLYSRSNTSWVCPENKRGIAVVVFLAFLLDSTSVSLHRPAEYVCNQQNTHMLLLDT